MLLGLQQKWGVTLDPAHMDFEAIRRLEPLRKMKVLEACRGDVIAALPPGDFPMLDALFPPPNRLDESTSLWGKRRQIFAIHGKTPADRYTGPCGLDHKYFVGLYTPFHDRENAGSLLGFVSSKLPSVVTLTDGYEVH